MGACNRTESQRDGRIAAVALRHDAHKVNGLATAPTERDILATVMNTSVSWSSKMKARNGGKLFEEAKK